MGKMTRNKPKKKKSKVPVFLSIVITLMIINIAILAIIEFCSPQYGKYETREQDANNIVNEYINKGVLYE